MLFTGRTHPKILFKAGMMQILLLALLLAALLYIPDETSSNTFNDYGFWVVALILLPLELYYVVLPALRWWNETFTLTDRRVKNNWGILYKNSREIDLQRIVSIEEERGILDRIFNCGTLKFYDAANPQGEESGNPLSSHGHKNSGGLKFHDISNVQEVRQMIERAKYNALENN